MCWSTINFKNKKVLIRNKMGLFGKKQTLKERAAELGITIGEEPGGNCDQILTYGRGWNRDQALESLAKKMRGFVCYSLSEYEIRQTSKDTGVRVVGKGYRPSGDGPKAA
jgi:hypothetical protein